MVNFPKTKAPSSFIFNLSSSPFPSGILIKKGDVEEEPVITIGPTTANDPVIPADPVYGKGFTIFEEAGKLSANPFIT